jgi:hypothetical protein
MYTFVTLSLALGASALVVPRSSNSSSSCSFELTASGGESGTIGQLSDGQNRIGGGLSAATFTIDNGGITDAAGRGCILTRKLNIIPWTMAPTELYQLLSNNSSATKESAQPTASPSPATDPSSIPEAPSSTPAPHQIPNGTFTPLLSLGS